MPKVTVFMAAYNASQYISKSIQSVLDQSYTDFELLIVNDGSTDDTVKVIQSFQDPRIRLIDNNQNKGIPYTRNVGVREAKGKYFAILDSDDISQSNRLETQVAHMEKDPDLAVLGSWAKVIDSRGNLTGETLQVHDNPQKINVVLFFENTLVHSSVMMRTDLLRKVGGYPHHEVAQDYGLFCNIAERHKIKNIPEFLVQYRVHSSNISKTKKDRLSQELCKIKKRQLTVMQIPNTDQYAHMLSETPYSSTYCIHEYKELYETLIIKNRQINLYDQVIFEKEVFNRWFEIILIKGGVGKFFFLFKSPMFNWKHIKLKHVLKTIITH